MTSDKAVIVGYDMVSPLGVQVDAQWERAVNGESGKELPMVTCILPTYNRRHYVSKAIEYFLRQDYPNKQLIIIDDGSDKVGDLVPDQPETRNNKLEPKVQNPIISGGRRSGTYAWGIVSSFHSFET